MGIKNNPADDSFPDIGNFEHLLRVTILSSPLYDIIYKKLSQCASCITILTLDKGHVNGVSDSYVFAPVGSDNLPRYGSKSISSSILNWNPCCCQKCI